MKFAMIVYSHYSRDARVRRYAELLAAQNHIVDIICLKENYTPKKNINLIFYPLERRRFSKLWYFIEYTLFFIFSFVKISLLYLQNKYSFIHVHNMPDFLVFAAFIPKMSGSKIILDMHDPMLEVFISKYKPNKYNLFLLLIRIFEKYSFHFADKIITANNNFKRIFLIRNKHFKNKITVIENYPSSTIFKIKKVIENKSKYTLMYMGTVADRYMLTSAVYAVSLLKDKIPNFEFKIFPKIQYEGKYLQNLKNIISMLKLNKKIYIMKPVPVENIAFEINQADLGILLLKKDSFTENIIPVKLLEFIKIEKPVISVKTKALASKFNGNLLYFLKSNSALEISNAILTLYKNKNLINKIIRNEKKFNLKNNWQNESKKYLGLVSDFGN